MLLIEEAFDHRAREQRMLICYSAYSFLYGVKKASIMILSLPSNLSHFSQPLHILFVGEFSPTYRRCTIENAAMSPS